MLEKGLLSGFALHIHTYETNAKMPFPRGRKLFNSIGLSNSEKWLSLTTYLCTAIVCLQCSQYPKTTLEAALAPLCYASRALSTARMKIAGGI